MAKLTKEQKIEIYERRLNGETIKSLALNFNINIHNIEYLIRLLNRHGYSILRNNKNRYYSKEFKEMTINRKENIHLIKELLEKSLTIILEETLKQINQTKNGLQM